MMEEERLIQQVETLTLDPKSFGHEAHVRLAFAYLSRLDLFEALERCRAALRRMAEHYGAPEKYHETVTCALVLVIHERMQRPGSERSGASGWKAFARANPDVLRWKDGAFFDYYPEEVLRSALARRTFVLPHPAPAGGAA